MVLAHRLTFCKAPFATLLLADYGAAVLRIDRPHPLAHSSQTPPPTRDLLTRSKSSVAIDLKSSGGLHLLRDILRHADVLVEPFRPGVLESLLLSPSDLLASNKRLVIARLTGFRRDGKYADMAGHDINYLAVSGVLSQLGRAGEAPYAPANILADFAGGGLSCAFGIIMALLERERTGRGQIVESNMVDGAAYLASMMRFGTKTSLWNMPRGKNLLDGGCPYYDVYECKDGGCMAVGALEPQFLTRLLKGLEMDETLVTDRNITDKWPALRKAFRSKFMEKTRKQWESIFDGIDACCTPVLGQSELEATDYDQRHLVHLTDTPGVDIKQENMWVSHGLAPGTGGEDVLHAWTGWKRGQDYNVENGGLMKFSRAKL